MYPDSVNLPFNHTIIAKDFVPAMAGALPSSGDGFWLLIQGNGLVLVPGEHGLELPAGHGAAGIGDAPSVLLGTWQGLPLFARAVSRDVQLPAGWLCEPFNAFEERIPDVLLTLGGFAKQVLYWQQQSRHCSRCGATLSANPGNWGMRCDGCGHEHFPAIHPCIIVLVRRQDEFLLTRKAEWPPGRYGLVAGFLDMGESLEECVHREVLEETGIEVTGVRYVGSQNWPFPSQLMAGFVADYAGGELLVDHKELEDARWFCPTDMPEHIPPKRSIARWIIDRYALHHGRHAC
jgi:NAD+ diphosphatase